MELTEDELVAVIWRIKETDIGDISESRLMEKVKESLPRTRKSLFTKVLIRIEHYTVQTKKGERWFVDL